MKTKKGKIYCNPSIKIKNQSCYSKQNLIKLTKKYNIKFKQKINIKKNKTQLWKNLNNAMKPKCKNEWCWEKHLIKLNNRFRPKQPSNWKKNEREWLDSNNIIDVMGQYEQQFNNFVFLGPVPIDFDLKSKKGNCLVDKLCKINIKMFLKNKKTQLGIIFNLDPHDKPGSHWTALFLDINRKGIYYFDSYGYKPEVEIKLLIEKLKNQLKDFGINVNYEYNNIRHQYKNSECGMYCLHFIITMLTTNKNFKTFYKKILKDDDIFKYRNKYFLE